jgi:outer membrane lipoprotein SlyB
MRPRRALFLAVLLLAGCAATPGAGERRTPEQEHRGVVESVREVAMDGKGTVLGTSVGAVIGGTVGGGVGSGRGAAVGVVVGTVLGGVAGDAVAQAAAPTGLEITVKLDDGRVIAVTQPVSDDSFRPGDRVRVVSDGSRAQVTR